MRPLVAVVAFLTLAVIVSAKPQKTCEARGGRCLKSGRKGCLTVATQSCPTGATCCQPGSRTLDKTHLRKCRPSRKCERKGGKCVSHQPGSCPTKSKSKWCKGRHCTCCLPGKQECVDHGGCAAVGGYCSNRNTLACTNGQVMENVCTGLSCACCIPQQTCVCGVANENRIVGGFETSPNEFPWVVGLAFDGNTTYSCGGTIINNQYILTAAHCLYDQNTFQPRNPSTIKVGVADYNQNSHADDIPGVTRLVSIQNFTIHPNYTFFNVTDDIALVKLAEPLDLTSHREVRPVCLPANDNLTYAGLEGTAVGWGYTSETATTEPDIMREVQIPILGPTCNNQTVAFYTITRNMLCAGAAQGGVDTCQGDSGGPLTVLQGGRYVQVGIASFGDGCARPNSPGVYTRVSRYLPWIRANTQGATDCGALTR
ncbi:trypsin-1-like [Procambarus clarkii]|nr:trypsin-1-like [Procambarus clarkii]